GAASDLRGPVARLKHTAIVVLGDDARIQLPFRLQPSLRLVRVAVRRQGPYHLSCLLPVPGSDDPEDEPLPAWIEVGRLTAVLRSRLERIVRTDGNVDL